MSRPVLSTLRLPLLLGLCSLALQGAPALAQEATTHVLSKQYGSVLFRVLFQETLYMLGRFDDYSGSLDLPEGDLAQARLEATVNMASLNMADGDVSELLVSSSAWFNSSLYPQAVFKSTAVEVSGENEAVFSGELTFMGQTRPWTLNARFFGGSDGQLEGGSVGMQAQGSFKRSDFGLDQYMNMAADEVSIEVNVKFNQN